MSYSGSNRSVDEYNRRGGSYYQVLPTDSTAIDVIPFNGEPGVYPDSMMNDDFTLTRQMSRYDGYEPSQSYWAGYAAGRNDSWGWHSPWYYSSFYPWYDSWYWYDPWYYGYYGWYGGWHSPWHYSYWYHPYGWYGSYYSYYSPGYGGGGRTVSYRNDHGLRTSNLRYYDRSNYSSTGVRRNIGEGHTSYRVGNVGSGSRASSVRRSSTASRASGTRTSSSSRPVSSYSSSYSSMPNTGSAFNNSVSVSSSHSSGGGGFSGGGFSGGGGGGGGGARSVGGGHGGGGRR